MRRLDLEGLPVRVTDPRAEYFACKGEVDIAIANVLSKGQYILGSEVRAFEMEFADFVGAKHAVGVSSGTDGISLALSSLGIGPGDEVITVSHTAVATVSAIEQVGAIPVLADVERPWFTINPTQLSALLTERTRAVIAVHLYGHPANLGKLGNFCEANSLALVEDASQAHGSEYQGMSVGTYGRVAAFSLYPTKNLGALGDAGVVVTDDDEIYARLQRLRQYGWETRNKSQSKGRNCRLDELQAAVLRVKLRHLGEFVSRRRQIAELYIAALADLPLTLPTERADSRHSYHLFVIETTQRHKLQTSLAHAGIETAIHYPQPVHLQPAYRNQVKIGSMSTTEEIADKILTLPMHSQLPDQHAEYVSQTIRDVLTLGS